MELMGLRADPIHTHIHKVTAHSGFEGRRPAGGTALEWWILGPGVENVDQEGQLISHWSSSGRADVP